MNLELLSEPKGKKTTRLHEKKGSVKRLTWGKNAGTGEHFLPVCPGERRTEREGRG